MTIPFVRALRAAMTSELANPQATKTITRYRGTADDLPFVGKTALHFCTATPRIRGFGEGLLCCQPAVSGALVSG